MHTTDDTEALQAAIDDAGHLCGWHHLMADAFPRGSRERRQHKRLARRASAQADEYRAELGEVLA